MAGGRLSTRTCAKGPGIRWPRTAAEPAQCHPGLSQYKMESACRMKTSGHLRPAASPQPAHSTARAQEARASRSQPGGQEPEEPQG